MRVLVTDSLHAKAIAWLEQRAVTVEVLPAKHQGHAGRLREYAQQADALIIRTATRVTEDLLQSAPRVRVVGRAGAGIDNIDGVAAKSLGVAVVSAPEANAISAAEHTVGLLLAVARGVGGGDASLKEGRWVPERPLGTEIHGLTLGVVGFGRIGQRVSALAKAFGMEVLVNDPVIAQGPVSKIGVEVVRELGSLLPRAQVLTVHTPLDETTYKLIGGKELGQLPPGAMVINCARGGIVDEGALLRELETGHLRGAGIDVFEQEPPVDFALARHPRVVATPHWGAHTEQAKERVGLEVAANVFQALEARVSPPAARD